MPDSSEDYVVLERLAARGIRTCGPGTGAEEGRLRAIVRKGRIPERVDAVPRDWTPEEQ
jgi:hypothetical protein